MPKRTAESCANAYELGLRLGAHPLNAPTDVFLRQIGRMRSSASAAWMPFTATQIIQTWRCTFDWRAKMGRFGSMYVNDTLCESASADVTFFGLWRIMHAARTQELDRGEKFRYLAEIAFAPAAILHNHDLQWRSKPAGRLVVSVGRGAQYAEVELTLNADGRIEHIFAVNRPRMVGDAYVPTAWYGRFADYRQNGGFWIPYYAEAGWTSDAADNLYWQAQIEEWSSAPERTLA